MGTYLKNIWPKGTGRYLLAQYTGIWLWFCLYFLYLLVVSFPIAGSDITIGRIVLFLWVGFNLVGIFILRAIAHSGRKDSAKKRKAAADAGKVYGELAARLSDPDSILYDAAEGMPEFLRKCILSFLLCLLWAVYSSVGFVICLMSAKLQSITNPEGLPITSSLALCAQCWIESTTLRTYVVTGALFTLHILTYLWIRAVRVGMERFILGPFYFEDTDKS